MKLCPSMTTFTSLIATKRHRGTGSRPRPPKAKPCVLLLLTGIALSACGGVPETFYYTVTSPAPAGVPSDRASNSHPPLGLVLGVEKFGAEAIYDDDRIIYRDSFYEIKYYHYRRWAASPRHLVSDEVIRQLRQLNCCRNVVAFPTASRVDYILSGRVLSFEEWDRGERWYGRVVLSVSLHEAATRKLIWSGSFEAERPADHKLPAAVAQAISASLQACILDLHHKLLEVLPPEP